MNPAFAFWAVRAPTWESSRRRYGGLAVGGMGRRLHFGRLWRRPGNPTNVAVVCNLNGSGGDLGVHLSEVWAVVFILGSPDSGLGVHLSGRYGLSLAFGAAVAAT